MKSSHFFNRKYIIAQIFRMCNVKSYFRTVLLSPVLQYMVKSPQKTRSLAGCTIGSFVSCDNDEKTEQDAGKLDKRHELCYNKLVQMCPLLRHISDQNAAADGRRTVFYA